MSSSLSTHGRHGPTFPNLISFLICLLAVSSCIQQGESHKTSTFIRKEGTAAGVVAFGFDLGQSYGTSAARFENGTTIPLAKVRGSAEYTALMEQIIRRQTPDWLSAGGHWLSPFRALKRCLGLIPSHSHESTVLAEMIAALKAASEVALQTRIEAVVVTAPWMLAWVSQIPDRHPDWVVNNALTLAGLEPWPTDHWFNEEFYLGEINTVLASEERWEYTRYGLDRESQATSSAQFWSELKGNLLSLVKQHATRDEKYNCLNPFTVLVAGEAANTPEFLDVMHDVIRAIPGLCASKSKTPEWAKNGEIDQVEFIIPNDLTYGAAKGAAIWLRRRMDWTYCAEIGIVDNGMLPSIRVNFAELQRLRLRQLQHTLVDHAVTIATTRTHPENWPKDLREYVQALQDYDYMGQRRQPRADPFLVIGERYVDRCILEAAMSLESNAKESLNLVGPLGFWETKDTQPEPVGGTRTDNYRRGWVKGFYARVEAAAVGGIFLIAPMWLMVLQSTMYTGLVATTLRGAMPPGAPTIELNHPAAWC
ncbi:hypothetical protein V492_03117 [Pseudogymnoascus sp. VKM F-4246]|nr:hypothetical protein V492_03117 [Pseudogymnoascus sp. VKM F-4246]